MAGTIIQNVRFDERGMIPAVVQDAASGEIVALRYMDNLSLIKVLQSGKIDFWAAGISELSDYKTYNLLDVRVNSDGGSLTVLIERAATTSSSETPVSLLNDLADAQKSSSSEIALFDPGSMEFGLAVDRLYTLIAERKEKRPEGSYTTYLFDNGLDKILKKIAEESGDVIIAAKNKSPREIINELADLFYHLLVLMVERGVKLSDIHNELSRRASQAPRQEKD